MSHVTVLAAAQSKDLYVRCMQTLRDGILRVGSSMAAKLESEPEVDEWFQCIGDSQNSHLLKLYAKVGGLICCTVYTVHILQYILRYIR